MDSSDRSPMRMAPGFYRAFLNHVYRQCARRPQNRWNRISHGLYNRLARRILKFHDPLLEHDIAGARLILPFSHRLPMYLRWHPRYASNLARLACHVQEKYPDLTLIDVGANVGDTIAIVRGQAYCPVLCIEGDPKFFPILQANAARFSDVHTARAFLGERDEQLRGLSVEAAGTAHFRSSATGAAFSLRRLDSLLPDFPLFTGSKLIKTDTDGYDAKVIRGAEAILKTTRPVLFFEYDPHFLAQQNDEPLDLLVWLGELGYSRLVFYDNFGELLLDVDSGNRRQLEEITLYFTGYRAQRYCDICAFHRDDEDLFHRLIDAELAYSKANPLARQ